MPRFTYILLIVLLVPACSDNNNQQQSKIKAHLADLPQYLSDVNTWVAAFNNEKNQVQFQLSQNTNASGNQVSKYTIFEAASLSKTVFAYLFWTMRKSHPELRNYLPVKNCNGETVKIDPLALLRHSMPSSDSCLIHSQIDTFKYSENNYLLLQKMLEDISGKSLEYLAQTIVFKPLLMNHTSFVWQDSFDDFVDGYYEKTKLHRQLRKFDEPKANGTLFTNINDINNFVYALMKSDIPDSIVSQTISVHRYKNLKWGNGMGIDQSTGYPILWQWGCNWSYNHILLLDKTNKFYIIIMTNSISGAKSLRKACNHLFDCELELFNYINWY
ncbi:MAG: beta-lactamase family protein [Bacteroidia bacterium]|nr:beta-lactamase family protein [Bacteroidia bacterium]